MRHLLGVVKSWQLCHWDGFAIYAAMSGWTILYAFLLAEPAKALVWGRRRNQGLHLSAIARLITVRINGKSVLIGGVARDARQPVPSAAADRFGFTSLGISCLVSYCYLWSRLAVIIQKRGEQMRHVTADHYKRSFQLGRAVLQVWSVWHTTTPSSGSNGS